MAARWYVTNVPSGWTARALELTLPVSSLHVNRQRQAHTGLVSVVCECSLENTALLRQLVAAYGWYMSPGQPPRGAAAPPEPAVGAAREGHARMRSFLFFFSRVRRHRSGDRPRPSPRRRLLPRAHPRRLQRTRMMRAHFSNFLAPGPAAGQGQARIGRAEDTAEAGPRTRTCAYVFLFGSTWRHRSRDRPRPTRAGGCWVCQGPTPARKGHA